MNADEVIEVLRGGTDPCAGCECYREPHGCNRPEGTCDAYDLCNEAADLIESLTAQLAASQRRERDARNELCQRCGRYKDSHNGACDGCRWKE